VAPFLKKMKMKIIGLMEIGMALGATLYVFKKYRRYKKIHKDEFEGWI
jgi:hypothetical protein